MKTTVKTKLIATPVFLGSGVRTYVSPDLPVIFSPEVDEL